MPANLDISQNIIAAFNQGRQLKLQREEQARVATQQQFQNEQEKQAADLRQKQYDEGIRQFTETQKAEKGFRDQAFNLQKAIHEADLFKQAQERQQELSDKYLKTGQTSGYTETNPGEFSPPPIPQGANAEAYNAQFPTFYTGGETPQSIAQKTADIQRTVLKPKAEIDAAEAASKAIAEATQKELDRANAREVARIRAAATNNPDKAAEIHANSPVTPADRDLFNVPEGTLYKEIYGRHPGVKLTPAQQSKVDYLDEMIKNAVEADNLLDPEKGGIGYQNYYLGRSGLPNLASGVGTEFLANRKGESNPKIAAVRNRLASNFDRQKVESAGKVLSPAELEVLRQYNIPYEHTILPAQGKENLKQFISNTIALRDKLISAENRVVGGTQGARPSLEELYNGSK